jgi:GNAT superfamily N-acetyltransferase
MRIENILEYEISSDVNKLIIELLVDSFPSSPLDRSYYKILPQFRYLVWVEDNLIGHMAIEHRVINNSGTPARIFGIIEMCVASAYRSQKIATTLLQQIEELAIKSNVDFLMTFADDHRLYTRNGYQRVTNICRWMKVHEHQTTGIDERTMSDCMMVKLIGSQSWQEGTVDLLGYLF